MNQPEALDHSRGRSARLAYATVLVELGDLLEAESELAAVLDQDTEDLDALSLLGKVKHMRGQLSQAIACWAQIHARSPQSESALLHLKAFLHLAQDPERGAGEFLALGQLQMVRRPAAHLELEEAFRLLLSRRPDEARARCERLARTHRHSDPALFKLATLAAAWMAELAGDPAAAVMVLERLGEERGFETDIDRVLMLVRLYERIGTRDNLEAAVHIYRYLESHTQRPANLARLGALYRRLGAPEVAESYERRYLHAFRRQMFRPSRADLVRVGAARYVPLDWVMRLELAPERVRGPSRREAALELALEGDRATARAELAGGGEPLDDMYRADLAVVEGDVDEARALYLAAVAGRPDDLAALTRLLDVDAEIGSPEVARLFERRDVADRASRALHDAIRVAPGRPVLWRTLGRLMSLRSDRADEAREALSRARALERAAARDAHPIGRVLAAGVFHFVGKAKGLIHEVWAAREVALPGAGGALPPDRILGNVAPPMRQAIQNTFLSVREYARSKFPHLTLDLFDYSYSYKITKEDERSYGLSAGLPTALAFLSVFLERPVPQDLATSGVVVTDAHDVLTVRPVGDTEHKVKAAYNRNLRAILLPVGNRAELRANALIPAAIHDQLVWYAGDLDEAVRQVFGDEPFVGPFAGGGGGGGGEERGEGDDDAERGGGGDPRPAG